MGRFLLEESLPRIPDKTKTYKVKHIIMTKSKPTQLDIFHTIKDYFFILDISKQVSTCQALSSLYINVGGKEELH